MPFPRESASPVPILKQTKDLIANISFDLILGKVAGFTTALVGAYLSARKIQEALKESAGAEALKNQFIALGMSASAAEAKIASLSKMAASGAVSFESLGNASKILRVIGGAAADTEGNLKRISDVFAASGAPVSAVATAYAQFYQAIKQGGDASSAAQDMANLGGISQDAAAKIRDLTTAGASQAQVLRSMQSATDTTRGASEALASSVVGLEAQLKNLEQENNIKIGEKFLEGEKAGLRAAIAFQKLKGTLQNGIADSIAPISNAWAELKEKIISSEGVSATVKGLGIAIQGLILVAGGVAISAFAQGLAFLGGAALKVIPAIASTVTSVAGFRAAFAATLGVIRGGLGILTSAASGWLIFGMAVAKAGMDAVAAVQNINKLTEAAQQSSEAKQNQVAENRKKIATIRTPEEAQRVARDIDSQLEDLQSQRAENNKKLQAANESIETHKTRDAWGNEKWMPLTPDWKIKWIADREDQAALGAAQGEAGRLDAQESLLKRQRLQAINQKGLGVDNAEDQRLRQEMVLKRQIRNEGVQSLQSSLSPEQGLQVGQSELERLQEKYTKATEQAPKAAIERRDLNRLEMNVAASENSQKFSENLGKLANFSPSTDAARLDQDATLRTTLREERAKQQAIKESASATNEQKADARERLKTINNVFSSRYGGKKDEISAAKTQELERQRDDKIKEMDPNELLQQMQAQMDRNQQMAMASGAKEASTQKEKERVDLEEQLVSLSNSEANAEYKAAAAGNLRVEQLKKAKAAAEELEKKLQEFREGKASKEDVQQAQINAAKAGTEGQTSQQIQQQLTAEQQILQVKLSAARVAENAAKAEYEAAMRKLGLERQLLELRKRQAEQLEGKSYGQKGEAQIVREGLIKDLEKAEEALSEAKKRDAVEAGSSAATQQKSPAQENQEQAPSSQVAASQRKISENLETLITEQKEQKTTASASQKNLEEIASTQKKELALETGRSKESPISPAAPAPAQPSASTQKNQQVPLTRPPAAEQASPGVSQDTSGPATPRLDALEQRQGQPRQVDSPRLDAFKQRQEYSDPEEAREQSEERMRLREDQRRSDRKQWDQALQYRPGESVADRANRLEETRKTTGDPGRSAWFQKSVDRDRRAKESMRLEEEERNSKRRQWEEALQFRPGESVADRAKRLRKTGHDLAYRRPPAADTGSATPAAPSSQSSQPPDRSGRNLAPATAASQASAAPEAAPSRNQPAAASAGVSLAAPAPVSQASPSADNKPTTPPPRASVASSAEIRTQNERAALSGVTPDTRTRDADKNVQEKKAALSASYLDEKRTNTRTGIELQIQGARIQEQYNPNGSLSQSAKALADQLEDQLAKADRVKELTSSGMSEGNAERVADIDVQRKRILSNIEKEGNPEASSLRKIGGSSGWAGMVGGATQDKQARLEQLNQQMVGLLAQLAKDSEQGMSYYRSLMNNNK